MKRKILLLLVTGLYVTTLSAQKKQQPVTGFAITAAEKGGKAWKEVRFVDIGTGEEVKSIYQSTKDLEVLNARTGKPVVKKDLANSEHSKVTVNRIERIATTTGTLAPVKKVVNLDNELDVAQGRARMETRRVYIVSRTADRTALDKPFSTNSAACAYDKKHERLYYTPMGINQLRYIDLKSKTPKIYYFEDEAFGVVKGTHDASNQITRMVIASDGNGYALSNNANHLIQFTTGKKPTITDLGALTDDAANGKNSVHGGGMYGGDMIADASKNLYLVTANRAVFQISIESKVATFKGVIKGLPRGFSTNGAMVEQDSKVIIASSESTVGYYRFDLNTLEAEKVSASPTVFNASDLANGNLAFDKKKKKKNNEPTEEVVKETVETVEEVATRKPAPVTELKTGSITVYPNPVTNGFFRLSFNDQPAGKYQVQVLDLSGKLISAREVNIGGKIQVEEFRLPELVAGGSYLVKIMNEEKNISVVNKIVAQ